MPLDPQAQAFLEQFHAAAPRPLWEVTLAEARAAVVPAPQPLPAIGRVHDVNIPGPAGPLRIRIYHPQVPHHAEQPLPAALFFHGGGWVLCGLDDYEGMCRTIANEAQAVVVSVDYRLAPENKHPAAVEDAFAALNWLAANAEEFSIDRTRLAVAGDSAGGHLAAVVSQLTRDRGGPQLAAQVLIYPVIDCNFDTPSYRECGEGYFLTRQAMQWFWQQYLADPGQADRPDASPLRAARFTGLPRALVITAEFDPLRDEGRAYASALRQAGIEVQERDCPGMLHGFVRRTDLFNQAAVVLQEIGAYLRMQLGPRQTQPAHDEFTAAPTPRRATQS